MFRTTANDYVRVALCLCPVTAPKSDDLFVFDCMCQSGELQDGQEVWGELAAAEQGEMCKD